MSLHRDPCDSVGPQPHSSAECDVSVNIVGKSVRRHMTG
jgi:hypothetical protein